MFVFDLIFCDDGNIYVYLLFVCSNMEKVEMREIKEIKN